MPLTNTATLVSQAHGASRGIAAFNVITLEHAEAVAAGAEAAGRPAILQISENAVRFHRGQPGPLVSAVVAVAEQASVPLAVHFDHVEDVTLMHKAAGTGVSSVMFDASETRLCRERHRDAVGSGVGAPKRPVVGGRAG